MNKHSLSLHSLARKLAMYLYTVRSETKKALIQKVKEWYPLYPKTIGNQVTNALTWLKENGYAIPHNTRDGRWSCGPTLIAKKGII